MYVRLTARPTIHLQFDISANGLVIIYTAHQTAVQIVQIVAVVIRVLLTVRVQGKKLPNSK
jgi:hypothetical protein